MIAFLVIVNIIQFIVNVMFLVINSKLEKKVNHYFKLYIDSESCRPKH